MEDMHIKSFLSTLPQVEGAFGYGSGVFKQNGNINGKNQIDLILVVKNLKEWHHENIIKNPKDYSFFVRQVGVNLVDNIFYKRGTPILFNPFIKYQSNVFKYGVVSKENFSKDLANWESFYFAGRFQKPVKKFKTSSHLDSVIEKNRDMAFTVGVALSNPNFYISEFLENVCKLSYIGDKRMGIAEHPEKVKNIMLGSFDELRSIYVPRLKNAEFIFDNDLLYSRLDDKLIEHLNSENDSGNFFNEKMDFQSTEEFRENILDYLKKLNSESSKSQIVKGFLSAGPQKSIRYVYAKMLKALA